MNSSSDIIVYCDEDADKVLFQKLKTLSHFLNHIPVSYIRTYPQISQAREKPAYTNIIGLFYLDRPDYIFTYKGKPILVVEMTEHAYTGDNGLQRFTRVASAAEMNVPFIYFGPLSRVRDDEFDQTDDPSSLSKRSLTSDFFEGMVALRKQFGSLQIYSKWKNGANGKGIKLLPDSEESEYRELYGDLIKKIEAVVKEQVNPEHGLNTHPVLIKASEQLDLLSRKTNTRTSDVKFRYDVTQTKNLLINPLILLNSMTGYFDKGKPDKLIALFTLKCFKRQRILVRDRVVEDKDEMEIMFQKIISSQYFADGPIVYYSGYKWRSDPHCGVAVNIFYRLCASNPAKPLPLILIYPRISIAKSRQTEIEEKMMKTQNLKGLFKKRYGEEYQNKFIKTISSQNLFGTWASETKQGRIFMKYCSLIICNDGFIVGNELARILE